MRQARNDDTEPPIERQYLRFLVEVGAILGETLDYDQTLQRVCEAAVRTVADTATMYLDDDGKIEVVAAAHVHADRSERLRRRAEAVLAQGGGPKRWIEHVIRSGEEMLVASVDDAGIESIADGGEHARFMKELGVRSFIIVPLLSQTRGVLGALALVYTAESGLHYDEDVLVIAEDLGRRCGAAIAKARLTETALDVSVKFQTAALPRSLPSVRGVTFSAFYEPASSQMMVGGDWYDAFELPDGRIGLSIGDVCGHGVEAAALMNSVRDSLRVALYLEADATRALGAADLLVREDAPNGMFATANVGIVDVERRTIACIAAGHPGPLMWNPIAKTVEDPFLDRGLPLGFRDLAASEETLKTIGLDPGSFLAFFTDGLLEAEGDYLAAEDRLKQALARSDIREARSPAAKIRFAVVPDRHADDLALLTMLVGP